MKYLSFVSALVIGSALSINAAQAEPYVYSPEHCEVSITFPEKPYMQNKCTGVDANKNCTEVVTFTKTLPESASSLNFRVTCHTDNSAELEKFTPAIMEETLRKMITDSNLEPFNIISSEADGFKKASSISVGEKNGKTDIYSGQIWIGKSSIFTLEAEMLGPKSDVLEKTFADILKNTKAKVDIPPTTPDKKK